ncbi:ICEBs1 integrase [Clostridium pasteurianum DSM 525 = ATCC 6013]|uniref:ICEBs1 integrase n=1 Tax=Clostridium pasteurianum DSM 525 = ATCC 6013 TaxID=1262449 RepID=A0A0H3J9P5_CLOPA|nr:site-specific integrase [Clostridium pasteurianum]AJA50097.1 ICEBs1 integrase [Clostridium pasteurianum DSM 525 = ATCC 6013]AJA54085.1 ICEBs1 integrase [Clostridium pasteurianum DSM 525 = ATCC 6013]AOZ77213.1 integrase [Clostridium pasteurianum DSM 525 = ATCC 6013]AOZ81009.1 integrase [Clostridium pasteurianum]ELP59203.1 phage integrase [Clostridium pasteurianum DSM 525 = ATCC 6013]
MPTYKDEKRGTWYCSFYYTDWTGAKKRKKKEGFKKESEAKAFERKFLEKQQNNCDMSFETLADLYLEDVTTRVRPTTMKTKKFIIDTIISPYFNKIKVNEVTPNSVRKWQNEMIKKGYSQTYLKTINNQIRAIFNFAIKYYNLDSSPALKAGPMGKKDAESMKFWTVEEFKKFIQFDDKSASELAFKILFWTGMRSGELMALTFKDVDLNNKTININKTCTRLNRKDIISEPKTPRSKRKISISESLCKDIKEYKDNIYGIKEEDRIFNFTKSFLTYEMRRISKKSEVKRIRLHDLRHSHASLLIELGFTPLLIAERLGHEKVETTLNTYSHLYPNKGKDIANKLDDLY